MIRNCDKTRLRKKAGLPEDDVEGEEGAVAKEWTQARNLDEEVEGGAEAEEVKMKGEGEEGIQREGEMEEGDGEVEREEPKREEVS